MALEKELEAFRKALPELLSRGEGGKYALIHDDQLTGVYDTREQALQEGYNRFELKPFLVKEVEAVEKPRYYSRSIKSCPT